VRRLGRSILPNADRLMQQLLTICGNPQKHMILEDVFLAVEAVLNAVGQDFVRYLNAFVPFLSIALEKHEEHQVGKVHSLSSES
jgi:importin subunit beta-1